METKKENHWELRSASYWMVMLIAFGISFIGIRFLADPNGGAVDGFGVRFSSAGDALFGRVKGIRDLFCGVILFLLLWLRDRRLAALLLGAAIIIPVTDGILVWFRAGFRAWPLLSVHWGTAVFSLITLTLLLRPARG